MSCNGIQFGLACFIMVAFTGLAGFMIVYHYATFERPTLQFAIVTDAGSTQTRSSLFTVELDSAHMDELMSNKTTGEPGLGGHRLPLAKLFQVKQVSSCLNGGPLAALQSETSATNLTINCLRKFSRHIKRLDFLETQDEPLNDVDERDSSELDSYEISKQLAKLNQRVNSVTQLYLGATAGMRALSQLNATRASEKIHWMDRALNQSNRMLASGPYINKAFLDIIDGSEEAAFGWVSVNYVCDKLEAKQRQFEVIKAPSLQEDQLDSVGTLELGGASAQMAYQVPERLTREEVRNLSGLESKRLELFNVKYQLATRSDLCLGMSQAVLRTYYVLLRGAYRLYAAMPEEPTGASIELPNACMQNRSVQSFSGSELASIFKAPCLVANELDTSSQALRDFIAQAEQVRFVGSGNTTECNKLLSNLIEPQLCKKYFSLCPASKNSRSPLAGMPFVTISGYNKALAVLDLQKKPLAMGNKLEQSIADNLGGYSVDRNQYLKESEKFCSLDVAEFATKFPKLNKAYYKVNCLQLVYIHKLLTEFYLFEPSSSWNQVKFLLFPVAPKQSQTNQDGAATDKNDIGWTLGLLLNATSYRLAEDPAGEHSIFYHHGASFLFIIRTTLFLMFACTLLAITVICLAILAVQRRRRSGQAYLDGSYDDSI